VNVKIGQNATDQSNARLQELRANRYPSLFFRTHWLYAPDSGYNIAVTNGGEYGVQLVTGLPLYDGGVKNSLVDQAATNVILARLDTQRTKSELAFSVRLAYYGLLRAQSELRIREDGVRRLQEYVTLLEQLQSGGAATETDVLKARVDLNNAAVAAEALRQSVCNSKLLLNNLMGKPPQEPIEVAAAPAIDTTTAADTLPADNFDLRVLKCDVEATSMDIAVARSERLPTLSVAGDVGALGLKVEDWRREKGYSVLLSLDVPIFTWGEIGDRIQQKQLVRTQKLLELEAKRRDLETEWRTTITGLEQSKRAIAEYSRNVDIARNNYLSAKTRFAGGSGSSLEVLDAHRLLVETQIYANNSEFQLRTAAANLIRLSGHEQ
jgi:outer membrane protein